MREERREYWHSHMFSHPMLLSTLSIFTYILISSNKMKQIHKTEISSQVTNSAFVDVDCLVSERLVFWVSPCFCHGSSRTTEERVEKPMG